MYTGIENRNSKVRSPARPISLEGLTIVIETEFILAADHCFDRG